MAEQLGHEALAEGHDLPVGFSLGVKIGAPLAAADGQAGQGVLKDLLEAKEFDNAQVYGRVEPQAALIGADSGIELYPEAPVYLNLSLIIHPGHPEHELALRLGDALQNAVFLIFRICLNDGLQRGEHLGGSLNEFWFILVLLFQKF